MILKGIDERVITFDCCKARIGKGSVVEIDDKYWPQGEIQGALKMKLVELLSPPPVGIQDPAAAVPNKKLRNLTASRIALDCIKGSIGPGETIDIPETSLFYGEIQNAISWRMLEDVDSPLPPVDPDAGTPAVLEEISVGQLTAPKGPKTAPGKVLVKPKFGAKVKAKPVSASKSNDLYASSKIIDKSPASAPVDIDVAAGGKGDADFKFSDIFEVS